MFGAKALAAAVSTSPVYIEDVFSTYLYTGNGSTQTITNGIDLAGEGGLVWVKSRNNAQYHALNDTARGAGNVLQSQSTAASINQGTNGLSAFTSSGFSVGADGAYNNGTWTYASWTFRKQEKFFDVVTYTGTGSSLTINHNLGSTPGCIIIKKTSSSGPWCVYHRSLTANYSLYLNTTAAETFAGPWITSIGTTSFTLDDGSADYNQQNQQFVAYLFAHNAGGFGLSGSDNVISCGSFTTNGSGNVSSVSLGYEPQWVLYKTTDVADNWRVVDNMRGMPVTATTGEPVLKPNLSDAEQANAGVVVPNATGFSINGASPSYTYIYIAIRRGPMKVPTSGTSVFTPSTVGATANVTVGFPSDTFWSGQDSSNWRCFDRLRSGFELFANTTGAEGTYDYAPTYIHWDSNSVWNQNLNNAPVTNFWFRRAPGFFDVVCWTAGANTNRRVTHNLGVVPEMVIQKHRSTTVGWSTYHIALGRGAFLAVELNSGQQTTANAWGTSNPTATDYGVDETAMCVNGATMVSYLFASCPGVSKVGSYTGTGTTLQIDCGFTGGARFVLIKRTDSTGDWYVYNSADGIVSGDDPYRILNGTTLTTGTDYVDTYSAGFELSSTAPAALNANGGTYIFLAIA